MKLRSFLGGTGIALVTLQIVSRLRGTTSNNNLRLTLATATKEELSAAPESQTRETTISAVVAPSNTAVSPEAPEEEISSKPYLVMHLGLHKTGATALTQHLIDDNAKFLLEHDNYVMLRGRSDIVKQFTKCFLKENNPDHTCYENRLNEVLAMAAQGRNVMIHQEGWSRIDYNNVAWQRFYATLQEHFQVVVVIYYRRHYERIYSWLNEKAKYFPSKSHLRRWPKDGGYRTPTLAEFFQQTGQSVQEYISTTDPNSPIIESNRIFYVKQQLGALAAPHNGAIAVRNYHVPNILIDFVCDAVPNATNTCNKFKDSGEGEERVFNPPDQDFAYDYIALESKDQGLLKSGIHRRDAVKEAKYYHEKVLKKTVDDLPLLCLSPKEREALRRISYAIEEQVMPSILSSHDAEFAKYNPKKFCTADAKLVLQDEGWRTYLSSLEE
jgi:hypothetical protein